MFAIAKFLVFYVISHNIYGKVFSVRYTVCYDDTISRQEAQLLQRGRAMLRVIEYFAKSLKVTQGHSK